MHRGKTEPTQWLIIADDPEWPAISRLPKGAGVIALRTLCSADARRLRHLARLRGLKIVSEGRRGAVRVHNPRELTQAKLRGTPLILLSPLFPTRTHPDWAPLPRMRAATLARLADRQAVALGGMNRRRYAKVAPLGFSGWAGISAFRT